MKLLRSISHLVSVSLLVLFLVGCLFVPFLAFGATRIDVDSVTNVYFVSYDDALVFRDDQLSIADRAFISASLLRSDIARARSHLADATDSLNVAYDHVSDGYDLVHNYGTDAELGNGTEYAQGLSYLHQSIVEVDDGLTYIGRADSTLDRAESDLNDIEYYLRGITNGLLSASLPTYQIVVTQTTSVTNIYISDGVTDPGVGGGCSCPDYTSLLNSIIAQLASLNSTVSDISNDTLDIANILWNLIANWEDLATGSPPHATSDTLGAYLGLLLGRISSNIWQTIYYADLYPQIGQGIFNDYPVNQGPAFLREMWNYILRPFAQTWADTVVTDNRMINSFRDYFMETAYVYPTNESHNPLWVVFTNDVSLSPEVYDLLFITNKLVVDYANEKIWSVAITNLGELAAALLDESEHRLDNALSEAESSLEQPDEETGDMPTTSFSFASSLSRSYRSIVSSYSDMFNELPSQLPSDIVLWQGISNGPVHIPSVHWNPHDESSGLNAIRTLFSFFWYTLYVVVIFYTAAIDLCVCGVLLYMVYGLLLGKSEVAYQGMLWCYKTLASFLGYKPQSTR